MGASETDEPYGWFLFVVWLHCVAHCFAIDILVLQAFIRHRNDTAFRMDRHRSCRTQLGSTNIPPTRKSRAETLCQAQLPRSHCRSFVPPLDRHYVFSDVLLRVLYPETINRYNDRRIIGLPGMIDTLVSFQSSF